MRRCVRLLATHLKNDFPRELTDFEKSKIAKMIKAALAKYPDVPQATEMKAIPEEKTLSHNVDILLSSLTAWDARVAIRNLSLVDEQAIGSDPRFTAFIARCLNGDTVKFLPSESLVHLITLIQRYSPESSRSASLLHELIVVRELDGLTAEEVMSLARCMTPGNPVTASLELGLIEWAKNRMDTDLLIELIPFGLRKGELVLPSSLVPTLSKKKLVQVLHALELCEFPELIARTVYMVSDALSRLTFARLVSDDDKLELLSILSKLKVKLDQMVYVENNPFYDKHSFVGKLLKNLSSDFHKAALSLPMPEASKRMVSLSCLNKLPLAAVDLIANRIQSFGTQLLAPGNISGSDFSNLVWAITSHPSSWKRKDKYRTSIGPQLAKVLRQHIEAGLMSPAHKISTAKSLMSIQSREIQATIAFALSSVPVEKLSISQLLVGARIAADLLKKGQGDVETASMYIDAIPIAQLTTPQCVELLETCRTGHLVVRVPAIVQSLSGRLEKNGGLISPSNAVKVLSVIGDLQIRNCEPSIVELTRCLPESVHPRLTARAISALALSSIANPNITTACRQSIEEGLLGLSTPDRMDAVLEDSALSGDLARGLRLIGGTVGSQFTAHLKALPASSDDNTETANGAISSLADELFSHEPVNAKISAQEWTGLLPQVSSTVGELLGAFEGTAVSATGSFEIETPYVWRDAERKIQITIVRDKHCARDNTGHILGQAAAEVTRDRQFGWRVIVLPESVLKQVAQVDKTALKKRVRRAKILHQEADSYEKLVGQFKQVLVNS